MVTETQWEQHRPEGWGQPFNKEDCYNYYMSGDINRDSEGIDEQCRWCAEGGNLICCDYCHNAFCTKCIGRNLGQKEISKIMDGNSPWHCYICRPEALLELVTICDSVFENLSHLAQQDTKKLKSTSEKNGKMDEHRSKKGGSYDEGKHPLNDSYSDSVVHSFSSLMIPKDLIQNTKKLIENTVNMNSSFIRYLEQTNSNSAISSTTRLNQLEAIRSVIRNISNALEDCINREGSKFMSGEKEKNIKQRITEDVTKGTKIQNKYEKYKVEKEIGNKPKFFHESTHKRMVPVAMIDPACTCRSLNNETTQRNVKQLSAAVFPMKDSLEKKKQEETNITENIAGSDTLCANTTDFQSSPHTQKPLFGQIGKDISVAGQSDNDKKTKSSGNGIKGQQSSGSHAEENLNCKTSSPDGVEKMVKYSESAILQKKIVSQKKLHRFHHKKAERKSTASISHSDDADKRQASKFFIGKTTKRKQLSSSSSASDTSEIADTESAGDEEKIEFTLSLSEEDDDDPEIRSEEKIKVVDHQLSYQQKKKRKHIYLDEHSRENQVEDTYASLNECPVTMKLVLEKDKETKEPLVQIHRNLVSKLKPHQIDGVQFMWDCCCESQKQTEETAGSGCILAHCMGLGKSLQVVTFLHTVLLCDKLNFTTALVVCPINTVFNWINEFQKWQEGIEDKKLEVSELATVKHPQDRSRLLQKWQESGGVMVIGYEMYRNLVQGMNIKRRKFKEIFQKTLIDPGPDFVICDEGHILKNENSAISKAMNNIRSKRRIILTGTPLQNNLVEYHRLVNFIKENLLGSFKEFRNLLKNPIENGQFSDSPNINVQIMKKRAYILYESVAGCVQRKDYTTVTKFLPPKYEYVVAVRMTSVQCKLYQYYLDHLTGTGSTVKGGKRKRGTKVFEDFQILSKIWSHPWCLHLDYISKEKKGYFDKGNMGNFISSDSEETSRSSSSDDYPKKKKSKVKIYSSSSESEDEELIRVQKSRSRGGEGNKEELASIPSVILKEEERRTTLFSNPDSPSPNWYKNFISDSDASVLEHSGKMQLLFEILKMAGELGDKILVFSQSLISLDLIEDFLKLGNREMLDDEDIPLIYKGKWFRNIDYYRLDGSTSAQSRNKWVREFNDDANVRGRLFLISTKAGALGINLLAANRVIIFDASWNPSYDVQSIFRVYRFGQNKPVFVYRFIAQGTMEEKIYKRQVTKQSLSFRVIDQQQIERHFTMNELAELYTFEPDLLGDPITEKKKIWETSMWPKDTILAELLEIHKEFIVGYHEHDSLWDHKEEELTEEERKAAWTEYEHQKNVTRI